MHPSFAIELLLWYWKIFLMESLSTHHSKRDILYSPLKYDQYEGFQFNLCKFWELKLHLVSPIIWFQLIGFGSLSLFINT